MPNSILAALREGWNAAISWLGLTPQAKRRIETPPLPPLPAFTPPVGETVTGHEVEAPAVSRAPRQRKPRADDQLSSWIHVDQLLDLLPRCREMMARLKRLDRRSYQFWRVIGVRLVDENVNTGSGNVLPEKHSTKGMVFIWEKKFKEKDTFPGFFVYFDQVKKNPWHCAIPQDSVKVFHVTVLWTDVPGTGFDWGYSYYVSANAQGVVSLCSQRQVMPQKAGFWRTEWGVGTALLWHYRDYCNEQARRGAKVESVGEFAVDNFLWGLNGWANTSEGFQIRAEQKGISTSFNISPSLAPKFFADRETGLTTDGKRYRIFHAVREHSRMRNGQASIVPAHYRGERVFAWNGENITITPPERGFGKKFHLEASMVHEDEKKPDGMVEMQTFAPSIRKAIESEWRKKVASQATIH